jgi:hypothetical protein
MDETYFWKGRDGWWFGMPPHDDREPVWKGIRRDDPDDVVVSFQKCSGPFEFFDNAVAAWRNESVGHPA